MSGREGDRVVSGGQQVRGILERERSPTPGGSGSGSGSGRFAGWGGDGQAVTDGGDVVDLRSVRKRSSLQAELKKLLGGRSQGRDK